MLVGVSYDVVLLLESLLRAKVMRHLLDFVITLVWGVGFVCCLIGFGDGSFRGVWLVACLCGIVIYLITIHRLMQAFLLLITKPLKHRRRVRHKKMKKE